jgi:hypothetical protein
LSDIELKGKSLMSVLSFYTRKRNAARLKKLSKLDKRWHKLWLNCAEWKCLLEVGIDKQGGQVSLVGPASGLIIVSIAELFIHFVQHLLVIV